MSEETAVVVRELPGLVGDPDQMVKEAQRAAQALMTVVENAKLSRQIGTSKHLQFEGWQTVGHFYGITAGIDWVRPILDDGKAVGYEARATTFRHGQHIGAAEAACYFDEPNWRDKPEFQVRSMAQTRALGKALRSVLAFVVVLAGYEATPAEEMDHGDAPNCQTCNAAMRFRSGTRDGKPWKGWVCPKRTKGMKNDEHPWVFVLEEEIPFE